MDAKELTKELHKKEIELTELRLKVQQMEMAITQLQMNVKDLMVLEGAVDQLSKRINSLERMV